MVWLVTVCCDRLVRKPFSVSCPLQQTSYVGGGGLVLSILSVGAGKSDTVTQPHSLGGWGSPRDTAWHTEPCFYLRFILMGRESL